MPDMPDTTDPKQLAVWLGVITSALTILAWFGATNWHQFEAWLKNDGGQPSQVTAFTPPTPTPMHAFSSHPAPALDRGCTETGQALTAFGASQQGAPTRITRDQAHLMAIEYRGFASNLDRAAADAKDPQVQSAINALAADWRTVADDLDADDLDAAHRESNQLSADSHSFISACSRSEAAPDPGN